jgi:imidazole glycerol phosphate synthase subunit HisF
LHLLRLVERDRDGLVRSRRYDGRSVTSSPGSTTIVNQPVARKAVTAKACKQTSSGWTATGTVTNPNAKQTTYTIVISFTTKASTVLARGTTKVTLKSGATKAWTASANSAKTKGVQCVLRGVAAS